jgi:hypothetical protein
MSTPLAIGYAAWEFESSAPETKDFRLLSRCGSSQPSDGVEGGEAPGYGFDFDLDIDEASFSPLMQRVYSRSFAASSFALPSVFIGVYPWLAKCHALEPPQLNL